jgi:hypothetical protein
VTTDEVANCLQINYGYAFKIIRNRLRFHKVCARWDLKELTMLHTQTHLGIYQENWVRYGNDLDAFFGRIITGNETWISHCEPESKWHSMEGNYP